MFDNLDDFKKKAIDNKANLSLWNLSKISNKSKDS